LWFQSIFMFQYRCYAIRLFITDMVVVSYWFYLTKILINSLEHFYNHFNLSLDKLIINYNAGNDRKIIDRFLDRIEKGFMENK
jgi:hypothetical protein